MVTPKRILLLAGVLGTIGAMLRILGISWGLDVLVVAVLVAVVGISLAQRSLQHELATARRATAQRLTAVGKSQQELSATLGELGKLQRTTLYYAKNGATAAGSDGTQSGLTAADPLRSAIAGRSSTPDVTNDSARHSFAMLLDSESTLQVAGLLAPETSSALPEQVRFTPLIPFRALESLDAQDRSALVVVDEAVFATAPWDRAVGPVGTGMMRDLVTALTRAQAEGRQIVILRHHKVPDIHDTALDRIRALRLPASETDRGASAGAPATPIITALARFAEERECR